MGNEQVREFLKNQREALIERCALTAEVTSTDNLGGIKHDSDKPDYSLLPPGPIDMIAQVWTFGKKKYAAYNWCKGFLWSRPIAAALRHIFAFMRGENLDPESGKPHLAHAICCLMMLLEFLETNTGIDDRYKRSPPQEKSTTDEL